MSALVTRKLSAAQVRKQCDISEIERVEGDAPVDHKLFMGLGQDRFSHALALCVATDDPLHNIAAVDVAGVGGYRAIEGALKELLAKRTWPDPDDVCYVFNFEDPSKPQPITLPKGTGKKFRRRVARILHDIKRDVPNDLRSKETEEKRRAARESFETWQSETMERIREFARGFKLVVISDVLTELNVAPMLSFIAALRGEERTGEGSELPAEEEYVKQQLSEVQKVHLDTHMRNFVRKLGDWNNEHGIHSELRRRTMDMSELIESAERGVAKEAITRAFDKWWPLPEPKRFRENLLAYAIGSYQSFLKDESEKKSPWESTDSPFLPFEVKLFVDHSETKGVPIVGGGITSLAKAIGSIGRGRSLGALGYAVDHRNLSPGYLHLANGGYAIVSMRDIATVPGLWQVVKSIIKTGEIPVAEHPLLLGTEPLHPEPLNARLKFVIFGPAWLWRLFSYADDEFGGLFKIRAEVLTKVERTPQQLRAFRSRLEAFAKAEGLHSLSEGALCALIEHASRLADMGDQKYLSTDLRTLDTLIEEGNALVKENAPIQREHIVEAIRQRIWRSDVLYQRRLEQVRSGNVLVAASGKAVGQINALVVSQYGSIAQQIEAFCRSAEKPFNLPVEVAEQLKHEYAGMCDTSQAALAFGHSTRITARVSVGKFAVVNLLKEVKQAGPIFQKADLTVQEILRGLYAEDEPLEAHAAFAFEQTYGGVEGDSASIAQLICLESAISKLPIRQDLAVTGSLNQFAEIQPIGGVNEKNEGWFDDCLALGPLTGTQGTVIPHQNAKNLMLRDDVVKDFEQGKFHMWAVHTLDEVREIFFELKPEEVRAEVKKGFKELADKAKKSRPAPEKPE